MRLLIVYGKETQAARSMIFGSSVQAVTSHQNFMGSLHSKVIWSSLN